MKTNGNQLKAGVILSYVNLGISFLIPLFYTPVMLRLLGDAEYGLYSLSGSAVSYLGLLSFGFGGTIIRYISKYRAENDKANLQNVFGFYLLLYFLIGIAAVFIGVFLSFHSPAIFKRGLTQAEISKIRILIIIMSVNTAVTMLGSVVSSVIISYEEYLYKKIIEILSTVSAPALNLIILYRGYGSIGIALAAVAIQCIAFILNYCYCRAVLTVSPKLARLPKELIKEMLGISFYIFIGSIVDVLFWSTDKMLLGMFVGSSAVAVYNIGGTFNSMVTSLSTSVSNVLTPRVTGMVFRNASKKELTDLFIKVGRIQFIIVGLILSGYIVFGKSFIMLWVGENYANAYYVALFTLIPLSVPLIQNLGISILIAQNRHKFRSVVYLAIAVANVISTYMIIPYYSYIGAAVCSGVSYIIGQGIIMNSYYHKKVGINIIQFWKNIAYMGRIPLIMLLCGLLLTHEISIGSWTVFFGMVIIYSIIYAALMYLFALNQYEKSVLKKLARMEK